MYIVIVLKIIGYPVRCQLSVAFLSAFSISWLISTEASMDPPNVAIMFT